MRRRILLPAPFAQAPAASSGPLAIASVKAWRLKEPESGRRYTVVRLTSQSRLTGYGEGGEIKSAEFAGAREIVGKRATAVEFVRSRYAATPALEAAIGNAMLELSSKATNVPLYRFLGGPVRFKVRLLARLAGPEGVREAQQRGFRAFTLMVPPRESMSRLQAYVDSVKRSMADFKKLAGADAEMVLDAAGALMPGDAAVIARAVERDHPIWFDEPSKITSQDALSRIVDESTLPVGLGRDVTDIADFQNMLRIGCVDVLRPSLGLNSVHKIRRIAAIAETHYIAVAPHHAGGPIGTMQGIHLGAALMNFYTQEVPLPASARDRAMRAEILGGVEERAQDGFAALANKPGLGVTIDEQALSRYAEETL